MKEGQFPFHRFTNEWFTSAFTHPSPPQTEGWPSIAAGQHTLILAPTGSGKTLAAFLWSIDQLVRLASASDQTAFEKNSTGVHTLYISPLKALNNDIQHNLKQPLRGIRETALLSGTALPDIRTAVRSGDTPANLRQTMLNKPPHILITTPESLYLLLTSVKGRNLFHNLKYLILDEIHAISGNKRGMHLSLSIERLMHLCQTEPVRIGLSATQKPLDRIAAFLGGQRFIPDKSRPQTRNVNIVDCGQRKAMDVRVISPVKEFANLPDDSVWEPVYKLLYDMIRQHKTTLVFTNMRAQTERIARNLNELCRLRTGDEHSEIALAHHGSISREARSVVEQKLREGRIPAVVATASLELGIDIGSIDLVIHLESPRSVSAALQRVGRSGHLLSATSRGVIIPLFQEDFDDSIALVRAMYQSEIEETVVPENALDVLAQHIVAEVAMEKWSYEGMYNLVRQSFCYRNLSKNLYDNVLEMLTGKYADGRIQFLNPRITWDKVNNLLIPRKGSRLIAVLNGGTIPDRGYYGVYLKDENIRLGEVEEEFVNETKIGESFFLGNSEWRLDTITNDRIIVTPVAAIKPKAPFWKGDLLYREYSSSRIIGAFREEALKKMESGVAIRWLVDECYTIEDAAENLVKYLTKQKEHSGSIATHTKFVGEWSAGSGGEPVFIFHAPVGGRINGLWVMAAASALEDRYGVQVQYAFNDNGFLLRFLETVEEPPMAEIFRMQPEEIIKRLERIIPESPVFSVQFRHNAARALILPRSQATKRIPLWLQRLRSADLLQAVSDYPEFPLLLETYRSVTRDLFDIRNLLHVLEDIKSGTVSVEIIHTGFPSPMASGLIFKFVATAIYEYDQSRKAGQTIQLDKQLLEEFYSGERSPAVISSRIAEEGERWWQRLVPERQAKSAEDLFIVIEELGPIEETELHKRATGAISGWLNRLQNDRRIQYVQDPPTGWISSMEFENFHRHEKDYEQRFLCHYMQSHGPLTKRRIGLALPHIPLKRLEAHLSDLSKSRKLICGKLLTDRDDTYWCDLYNFQELYRRAIGLRRTVQNPADPKTFNRFLLNWQLSGPKESIPENFFERYNGYSFPLYFFEREILPRNRFAEKGDFWDDRYAHFLNLISDGEINVRLVSKTKDGQRFIAFYKYGQGNLFDLGRQFDSQEKELKSEEQALVGFLRTNGASRIKEIETGLGWRIADIEEILFSLADSGMIGCDQYENMITVAAGNVTPTGGGVQETYKSYFSPGWMGGTKMRKPRRSEIKNRVIRASRLKEGRWFLLNSLAFLGNEIDPVEQAVFQARLLLNRYGVLVKEWYRRESGLLPWYTIFQALKKLEWQGEIRRGFFVKGLSGVQFALPAALDLLEEMQHPGQQEGHFVLCSTVDPALPLGGIFKNSVLSIEGKEVSVSRGLSNHLIFLDGEAVVYMELYGRRLWFLTEPVPDLLQFVLSVFKRWLNLPEKIRPKQKIEIDVINNQDAYLASCSGAFLAGGFERNDTRLILWPTQAG